MPAGKPERERTPEKEMTNKYALLSVFDKTGIVDFARVLDKLGYKIISTGGTAKTLLDAGITVVPIQDITGNPESFDGRMKTISFQAEGGILFDRENPSHVMQAKDLGIKPIDLVVCNLYPFEQTIAKPNASFEDAVENIDVGGPTMVRAAAKNFKNVLVVVDPKDYEKVAKGLEENSIDQGFRRALAAKAFGHLSFYDSQIARFLNKQDAPEFLTIPGRNSITLRYGENPHQRAVVYLEPNTNSPLAKLQRLGGKELGMVNLLDISAGIEVIRLFPKNPCSVVIKHGNPSGAGLGETSYQAMIRSIKGDQESAFGGIIVNHRSIGIEDAKALAELGAMMDIFAAPSITPEAVEFILKQRKDETGIYSFGEIPSRRSNPRQIKSFDGGFIVQEWNDSVESNFPNWQLVTNTTPTPKQTELAYFGWLLSSRIKSNTVLIVDSKVPMTRGIGSGQTSRVLATKIALERAGEHARGGIMISDSFFPFDDSVKLAAKYGIGLIVQQGGSKRDKDSIKAANDTGIPMFFTGQRSFWH